MDVASHILSHLSLETLGFERKIRWRDGRGRGGEVESRTETREVLVPLEGDVLQTTCSFAESEQPNHGHQTWPSRGVMMKWIVMALKYDSVRYVCKAHKSFLMCFISIYVYYYVPHRLYLTPTKACWPLQLWPCDLDQAVIQFTPELGEDAPVARVLTSGSRLEFDRPTVSRVTNE